MTEDDLHSASGCLWIVTLTVMFIVIWGLVGFFLTMLMGLWNG